MTSRQIIGSDSAQNTLKGATLILNTYYKDSTTAAQGTTPEREFHGNLSLRVPTLKDGAKIDMGLLFSAEKPEYDGVQFSITIDMSGPSSEVVVDPSKPNFDQLSSYNYFRFTG